MNRWLGPYSDYTFSALRIVSGFLFSLHGAQKLFGVLGGEARELFSLFWLAGVIEFVGGLLLALGLFTPVVAFVASGEMAAAYFMAHAQTGFWPIENGGELPALYCFLFLFLATRPAGPLSLDRMRR